MSSNINLSYIFICFISHFSISFVSSNLKDFCYVTGPYSQLFRVNENHNCIKQVTWPEHKLSNILHFSQQNQYQRLKNILINENHGWIYDTEKATTS